MPEVVGTRLERFASNQQSVRVRLIQKVSTPGGVPVAVQVMDSLFREQDPYGVNGPMGWSTGSFTSQLSLEGSFTLNFPNAYGADGMLHRNRFLIITSPTYEPGEEWFEIWQNDVLLFVGTPTGCQIDQNTIQITGVDGWWLLNKVRETAAGHWHHAPRDVVERYCQGWVPLYADDFTGHTTWTWVSGNTTDGSYQYSRAENYGEGVRVRPSSPNLAGEVAWAGSTLTAGIGTSSTSVEYSDGVQWNQDWTCEWVFTRSYLNTPATPPTTDLGTTASYIRVGFYLNTLGGTEVFSVAIMEGTIFLRSSSTTSGFKINTKVNTAPPGPHSVKFEQRDYWVYVYVNGTIVGCLPMLQPDGSGPYSWPSTTLLPFFRVYSAANIGGDEWAVIQKLILRQSRPMLQRQGDASIQTLAITGSPTGGSYTLSYGGLTTASITYNASPSSAINALASISSIGGVTVSGSFPTYTLTFNQSGQRPVFGHTDSFTGGTSPKATISYATTSQGAAAMGHNITDVGEKRLPGSYPAGGLVGEYFDDSDISNLNTDLGNPANYHQQLSPFRTPYYTRAESSIYFAQSGSTVGGGWEPSGPPNEDNFSARWTGSIYLDLDSSDYRIRFGPLGRFRVWLGGTRFQDRLFDTWTSGGTSVFQTSDWLYGTSSNPGPLYGERSGWFPILIEWSEDGAPPQLTYQYGPYGGPATYSDFYPIPGSTLYGTLQLTRSNLEAFWPLNEGRYGTTNADAADQGGANLTLTENGVTTGHATWTTGPFLGTIALEMNTDNTNATYWSRAFTTALNPTNSKFTISAWIRLSALNVSQTIMQSARSSTGYSLLVNSSNHLQVNVNNGNILAGNTTFQKNVWYHVAVTYDSTTARLYVNGQSDASATALTYTPNTLGDTRVGAGGLFGGTPWTAGSGFQGRISNLAFYSTMVSAANILNDYNQQFTIDTVALSQLGTYNASIRMDSHYNQLQAVQSAYGHQMTCAPRSLESGEFPGVIAPKTRIGRDTEYVLTADDSIAYSKTIDATDTVDALLGDAQGLGDIGGDLQLTYEAVDLTHVTPGLHMFIHQDYDQASQVSDEAVFKAYLNNLLALRESPWEQLQAQPPGASQYIDQFPLTGALAAFRWSPGDGVRIDLPSIAQVDSSPRQIMGVQWQLAPGGIVNPVVAFRQRPRDLYRSLRSMQQAIWNTKRSYQTQLFQVTGSMAGFGNQQLQTAGGATLGGVGTNVTRVGLPHHLNQIVKAEVVVESKTDTTTTQIWTNASANGGQDTGIRVKQRGRYDVTGFIGRANGTDQFMSAFFRDNSGVAIPNTAGYGGIFHLELLVRA